MISNERLAGTLLDVKRCMQLSISCKCHTMIWTACDLMKLPWPQMLDPRTACGIAGEQGELVETLGVLARQASCRRRWVAASTGAS